MLKSKCKHCHREITYQQGDNGVWYEAVKTGEVLSQYCWVDMEHGSQLHQPDTDTIVDVGRA